MSDEKEPTSDHASDALASEMYRIIEFHVREYTMSYATVVGTIELVKASLIAEWMEGEEELDDEDVALEDLCGESGDTGDA
jgi:hypothetical protein